MIRWIKGIIPNIRVVLVAVILGSFLLPFIVVPPTFVFATPIKQDSFETDGGVGAYQIYGAGDRVQTFTTTNNYNVTSVKILSWKTGEPGNVTAGIQATDSNGNPTGGDLVSGTASTSGWPTTEGTRAYNEITFTTPYTLPQGVVYGISIKAPSGNSTNYIKWQWNNDLYSGGKVIGFPSDDALFQVWGETVYPSTITLQSPTNVTGISAALNAQLTSMGDNSNVDISFQYGYTNDSSESVVTYSYSTTPQNFTSAPQSISHNISSLLAGYKIFYRAVVDGDILDYTSSSQSFYTSPPPSYIAKDNLINRQGAVTHVFQRKGWYAAGRYWIIYAKQGTTVANGGGFFWRSSVDGITWSDPYLYVPESLYWPGTGTIGTIGNNEGDELNVYFDGTYLHAVYVYNRYFADVDFGSDIWYRRGVPNTDGTITFTSSWVNALPHDGTNVRGYASIVTDSNGYPFIDYWKSSGTYLEPDSQYGTPNTPWDRYVIKSSTKDGTFTVAAGYPFLLKSNIGGRGTGSLVQLTGGKLYWIGAGESQSPRIAGRLYDGTTWGSEETIATTALGVYRFSAVSRGDIVYLAYTRDTTSIYFTKRLDTGWTSPIPIVTGLSYSAEPDRPVASMTINQATGDLYVFYDNFTADKIYYILHTVSTGTWGSPVEFVDESYAKLAQDNISTHLGSFMEVYGGKIGVYYVQAYNSWAYSTTAAYLDLRFSFLTVAAGPAVQTNDATAITGTSATLQGYLINNGGQATQVRFDWGTSIAYGGATPWQSKTTGEIFSAGLTGLTPGTTYFFRAVAQWADLTTTYGTGKTFLATALSPPTVVDGSASSTTPSTATLQGTLTSLGGYSTVYVSFEWGPTVSYGTVTADQTRTSTGAFSAGITGLSASTTYYFRARVRYDSSYAYGAGSTFLTPSATSPLISTISATVITQNSAVLTGSLDSMGSSGTVYVYFQYGTTVSYGTNTTEQTKTSTGAYTENLSGLSPGTVYYYRAAARYNSSYVYGNGLSFPTETPGGPTPSAPTSFGSSSLVTQIDLLWVKGAGSVNTLIRYSTSTYPATVTDGFQLYLGTGTTYSHTSLTAGVTYYYSAWGEAGGTYSINKATTFAQLGTPGTLPPPSGFQVESVKVFKNYLTSGDLVFVMSIKIFMDSNPIESVGDSVKIQVLDGNILKAQGVPSDWGYRPASIYLGPGHGLVWGAIYTVKMIGRDGVWTTTPSSTFELGSSSWMGSDLSYMKDWILSIAQRIGSDMVTYEVGSGQHLTLKGGEIFEKAIPGLRNKLGTLFLTVQEEFPKGELPGEIKFRGDTSLEKAWGSETSEQLTALGSYAGLSGENVGGIVWGILMLFVVGIVASLAGAEIALVASLPLLLAGAYLRLMDLAVVIVIGVLILMAALFKYFVKSGA